MASSGKPLTSVTIRCKRRNRPIATIKTFKPRPNGKPSNLVSGGGR
jgi:hypothetical protein